MAAGIFLTLAAMGVSDGESFRLCAAPLATLGFLALNAGLAASVFHLGRPLGAWRFFLGLRTSWMSREILAFGLFAGAAFAAGALCWILPGSPLALAGVAATGAMGLIAVFTSVMIYVDTRRAYWSLPLTAARFYGATILLGVTAAAAGMGAMEFLGVGNLASAFGFAVLFSILVRTLFFGWEIWSALRALRDRSNGSHRSEQTIRVLLPWLMPARVALFVVATLSSVVALVAGGAFSMLAMSAALAATFASQVFERFSFFGAVTAPHMPRGV